LKKHRYKVSFFITALLYLLPALLYVYLFRQAAISVDKPSEKSIELSLSQFVPQAPPTASPEPVQEEQLVEDDPEPEQKVEEEPEPEPKPEKVMPPVVKEMPVPEPVKKAEPKPKKKQIKKAVKKHKKRKKVHRKRKVSGGGTPHYSAAQKNAFLAKIRAKINRAKSYPRIAQRRGMQGTVNVRFTILANGAVSNIRLSGPTIFHASARKAVQSAFPVNVKRATIKLPTTVKLSLRYKLR
jgi:protein TonB